MVAVFSTSTFLW